MTTPSPEARYPIAIEQAYAATKRVAEHGDEIDVEGSRMAMRVTQRRRQHDRRRHPHGHAAPGTRTA